MKALSLALAMTVGIGVGVPVLEACGAKFLVSSRAARYQKMQATQEASIFLYWNQTAATAAEAREGLENYEAFREFLEKVGYTIQATTDEGEFREAARSGDFDVILMPLDAARQLQADVLSLAPNAKLLPVVEFATRAEKAQAEQEFGLVLSTPATTKHVLTVLGEALDS